MPELSSSPPRNPSFRIAPPHHFLSLSETTGILSPRGQTLPALIGSRSATNLRPSRRMSSQSTEDFESDYGERPRTSEDGLWQTSSRKSSIAPEVLLTPQMRSMRLIGNSNPRYRWGRYYKSKEELKEMKKSIRGYYERNNFLISQYLYIDRLLDSSLPHNLIQEYHHGADIPQTISEEPSTPNSFEGTRSPTEANATTLRVKRTPKALYKLPDEATPLLDSSDDPLPIDLENGHDESVDSGSSIVAVAIAINFVANAILLAGKVAVIVLTSSLSVLASLVDGVLDFLSTAIVYFTTKLIARQDQYSYPIGRRQLEPIGVLVFSVIMITSFFQVALECFTRLTSDDRSIVELGTPAIAIMISTVVIKGGCWFWCRLIKNSSVQALAQDAMTDGLFS